MNCKVGIIAVVISAPLAGCFSPDPKSLTSDSAPSAIPAIKDAAIADNRQAVPRLVTDLSDNDPAIRFAAITALQRITGESFDYRYYDSQEDREPAVQRWKDWLAENPVK